MRLGIEIYSNLKQIQGKCLVSDICNPKKMEYIDQN